MNKSIMREYAFKFLYSLQFFKDIDSDNLDFSINYFYTEEEIKDKVALEYINDVIYGIYNNHKDITDIILKHIKPGWPIDRIYKIDISLIKLGIYELLYSKLPYKIVVNEVVELAKKYGDENSQKFVNGILATIISENKLNS